MAVVRRLINQVVFETDEQSIKNADKKVSNFKANMKKVAMATGAALLAIGGLAIKGAADMEMMTTQFEVMLGSAEKANGLMTELKKFSASTPFSLSDLAQGTQTLMSFGVAEEDVIDRMRMLGDTAGGNSEKLKGLILAYGKVQVKGKASMEEINMMAERGIPIIDTLTKNLGVTEQEFFKLVSSGKIGRDEITNAFKTMTSEGGMFFEGMKKQSMTFSGMLSTMKDNITLVLAEIGTKLLPTLKLIMDVITQLFQGSLGNIISDLLTTLTPLLQTIFEVVTSVIDRLMPVIASITKLLKPIISLINVALKIVMVLFDAIMAVLGPIIDDLANMLAPLIEEIAGLLLDLLPILTPILQMVVSILATFFKLQTIVGTVIFKLLVKGLTLVIQLLRPIIKLISIFLVPLLEGMSFVMSSLVNFIDSMINKIVNGITSVMTFVFDIINNVIEAVNALPFVKDKLEPLNSQAVVEMIKGKSEEVINKTANINQQNSFNFNGMDSSQGVVDGVKRAVGTPFQVELQRLVIESI